jgi:hypothetical protein
LLPAAVIYRNFENKKGSRIEAFYQDAKMSDFGNISKKYWPSFLSNEAVQKTDCQYRGVAKEKRLQDGSLTEDTSRLGS